MAMNPTKVYLSGSKFLLAAIISFSVACSPEKKKTDPSEFNNAQSQRAKDVISTIGKIPPPAEIPYIIQSTGADFNPNIVNSPSKYQSYTISAKKAAFNLGVYATDIGYLSSYGKTQEAITYLDVCLKLTETIGAKDAVDFKAVERFEKNLSKPDSLASIINELISSSDKYLKDNDRNNIAALVVSGTFIEALYIATQIIATYPKNMLPDDMRLQVLSPLVQTLAKQKDSLKDVIALLESVDNKDEWEIATINSLQELYDNYTQFDPMGKISDNRGNEVLNDQVLTRLSIQVDSIRTNVVY